MKSKFRHSHSFQLLNHWRRLLHRSEYRRTDQLARTDFNQFCREGGGAGLQPNLLPNGVTPKTALIVGHVYLPFAKLEALMMKAFQMAGFETVVLGARRFDFLRYDLLAGNKRIVAFSDFPEEQDDRWVDQQFGRLARVQDWLELEYRGVHVGRFAVASALRQLKIGQLDFADPKVQETMREILSSSVRFTLAGIRIMEKIKPDCVLLMDRGYSGQGEIFDLAINRGIDTLTWNLGYKSSRLILKRYHPGNEREHPYSPSPESWERMQAFPWKAEYGRQVRLELFQCYDSQDWFSVVGTQFDKKIHSRQVTREKLGLTDDKKVAVIFPHILWDGSFFWGKDLFDHYTHWFVETMRAAAANPRIQWVVKLHPAHLVKAKQANDSRKPAELQVLEKDFKELPPHIKLVYPDTDMSTYSLFEIADYAVTVRGTVGIECALFGIPVLTAGTGRYDRRGFTVDSTTQGEYLDKLARLETFPKLTPAQIELAERYAYTVFFCRPLRLSSVSFECQRDGRATPKVSVHCQTREQWLAAPDMRLLSSWIAEGKSEDMLVIPSEQVTMTEGESSSPSGNGGTERLIGNA